jgi:hypothetical protein
MAVENPISYVKYVCWYKRKIHRRDCSAPTTLDIRSSIIVPRAKPRELIRFLFVCSLATTCMTLGFWLERTKTRKHRSELVAVLYSFYLTWGRACSGGHQVAIEACLHRRKTKLIYINNNNNNSSSSSIIHRLRDTTHTLSVKKFYHPFPLECRSILIAGAGLLLINR